MHSAGEIGLLALFCGGLFLLAFLTCLLMLRIFSMQRVPQIEEWVAIPMQAKGTHHRYVSKSSQTQQKSQEAEVGF